MSSKSNPKHIRNTYGRPIVINVEQAKPEIPLESKKENNPLKSLWSIIGFSSIVTAILFMIGWAYVSNWYAYFGVSMGEVSVPPQQILISSTGSLLYLVLYAITAYFLYYTIGRKLGGKKFYEFNWRLFLIIFLSIGVLFVSLYIFIIPTIESSGNLLEDNNRLIKAIPAEVYYLYLAIIGVIGLTMALRYAKKTPVAISDEYNSAYWMLGTAVISILIAMVSSAMNGIFFAAYGVRGFGVGVEKVYLASPMQVDVLKDAEKICDTNNNCVYGPFGLITVDNKTIFLAKWEAQKDVIFLRGAGLYRIPHNDTYLLIPASSQLPNANPKPTTTPASSQP